MKRHGEYAMIVVREDETGQQSDKPGSRVINQKRGPGQRPNPSSEYCNPIPLHWKNLVYLKLIFAINQDLTGKIAAFNKDTWRTELIPKRVQRLQYIHLLAFKYIIEEINRNPDILPNITLGYHVYDSCRHVGKVTKDVLQILSGHNRTAPNYSCKEHGTVVGFIGDLYSVTSIQMAQLLNLYGYIQISYGARDNLLSDRRLYPNFFRTAPSNQVQYIAILKLLEYFHWNWVGIITSDDDYGERELQQLSTLLTNHNICIEFRVRISLYNYNKIPIDFQTSSTEVLIICGSVSMVYFKFLYNAIQYHIDKTFILTESWFNAIEISPFVNCSLIFISPHFGIHGFEEYVHSINPVNNSNDPILEDILITDHQCLSQNSLKNLLIPIRTQRTPHNCTWEKMWKLTVNFYSDSALHRVYNAVWIMTQALSHVQKNKAKKGFKTQELQYMLANFIKRTNYSNNENEGIYFKESTEEKTYFNILNLIIHENGTHWRYVGQFNGSRDQNYIYVTPFKIAWKHGRTKTKGRQLNNCGENTKRKVRDSENCQKCSENEWPSETRSACVAKMYEFLSYEKDVLALLFIASSGLSSSTCMIVFWIFVLYRKTIVVKANNRNLSFLLLVSLKLSLLSVFLFLGCPSDISCMLSKTSFGISFTIAVSSLLGKTVMVCIAFKANRPNSSWRKCVGVKLPNSVVLICSSIQFLIVLVWLSVSPPYQEYTMNYNPGKIIIQCNDGSLLALYLMLGYMGFLAAVSFFLAFMVRTLPDMFNEAKYITFSMLVFCSVWICAIPAYVSSKGKQRVIVEVFAILASGIGILSCIFFPKCYNILVLKRTTIKLEKWSIPAI
ncbi:vomeronasal type-2 receptor 26-like [Gastrophryne carolinensis]